MIYLKEFENQAAYDAGKANLLKPNVALITGSGEIMYEKETTPPTPPAETRIVATFNVTNTNYPIDIIDYNNIEDLEEVFSAIEIDGTELPEVVGKYTFTSTGTHTVKYTLTHPTSIAMYAFSSLSNLISIVIPDNVTSIDGWTFDYCDNLESVIIGNGVTSIGKEAFHNCYSLTSVTIGSGVTSIDSDAFYNEGGVVMININCYPNPANLTWEDNDDFNSSTTCHVYSQYLTAYQENFSNLKVTFVGDLT